MRMVKEPDALSVASPVAIELYRELLPAVASIGPFEVEVKRTSVHLVRASAFAGVAFRKQHIVLTVKSTKAIASPRIFKSDQASKNRWHLEVKLAGAGDIDAELLAWLRASYEIS
ncbi:MAG: hypothetical protein JWP63_1123 [Candidatus Solibacter sp.]|jgi:hypothetical protein|nr:hypothetical protein [Candidatus Solibacter sp.]